MADFSGVRVLVFRVGDLSYGAHAEAVREILPRQTATRVPGAPDTVAGLINVRGTLVTVVDGRRTFGHPPAESGGSIVLLEVGTRTIGLVVDEVVDLLTIPADDLADRGTLPGVDPRIVRAVGRRGSDTFVLLDLGALFGPIFSS